MSLKGSWKTTVLGISSAVAALITFAVVPLLDGDPATSVNLGLLIPSILAAFGIYVARDDDKSSEDVGAK